MRSFRHPRWQHLDYRVKVATTQENKPPIQGTRQWTFTTPRWRCGSILLPSLNAGVPEPTGGSNTNEMSTLVKLMAWCRQARKQYLSQYWPRSTSTYGIPRPQWVNYWASQNLGFLFISTFPYSICKPMRNYEMGQRRFARLNKMIQSVPKPFLATGHSG